MEAQVKLLQIRDEAKGTKTFVFEKPQGFQYIAGQYAFFTLPELKYPDERGNVRHFTLSTSPTEKNISFTTRFRDQSGYKKTIFEAQPGYEVTLRGPFGVFALENESIEDQQVMLAGGIGITPFRSIAKYVTDKNLPVPIHIIYSNSVPEEIAFKKDLDGLAAKNPNLKVTYTITKPEKSQEQWTGPTGRIDAEFIQKMENGKWKMESSSFWLCGPPLMVSSLEDVLGVLQIPHDNIRVEKFTGY